ncbi:hypothetical protein [Arvimicrobium flavum]|uniref:hypothetical protein n=1 Tax=Arvimicrobium flavum TaxID=3393320 RepID=UPI00237AF55B|nr:hypothetical protein [Mesorhizobium shangrilense]
MEPDLGGLAWGDIGHITALTTALSTASAGLVDATKAFRGGISNIGYGFIDLALTPFMPALKLVDAEDPSGPIKANWLNGMDKTEQKAAAKNLIRLGLTPATAATMGKAIPNVDGAALEGAALKVANGSVLEEPEVNLLARFDAIVEARLDAAYERAEQKYRNTARVAAAAIAIVLSMAGWFLVFETHTMQNFLTALAAGLLATPLAPISKDLMSALSTAAAAFKSSKS